ncbi:MAG: biotin/lipoyl-binding protein [Aliidongia sp.]
MTKHDVSIEIDPQSLMSERDALPQPKKRSMRKALIAGASLLAIAGATYFGWQYWTVGRFEVSTDDAYVQADNMTVAPKISGYLGSVLVEDNQQVKAGQVLARIDDRDFEAALDQADADVASARALIASKQAALETQQSVIEAARPRSRPILPTRPSPSRTTGAMPSWSRPAPARCSALSWPPRRPPSAMPMSPATTRRSPPQSSRSIC